MQVPSPPPFLSTVTHLTGVLHAFTRPIRLRIHSIRALHAIMTPNRPCMRHFGLRNRCVRYAGDHAAVFGFGIRGGLFKGRGGARVGLGNAVAGAAVGVDMG